MEEYGYDLRFREIEEKTGYPKTCVHHWWVNVAKKKGWRSVYKRYVPHLEKRHMEDRVKFAKKPAPTQ